ncbi:MAG: hypothetical protein JWP87_4577 [Labilithrix sp.]|nr:hypothetical protein [Labilithrix sp.]
MKYANVALLPLAAVLASGCYGKSGADGALFATAIVAGAVVTAANEHAEYERALERERERDEAPIYQRIYLVNQAPAAAPAPPPPLLPPPPPPFDAKSARIALSQVDLAKCREAGAPRGYGHAKATINPSGDISKVVIDEPTGMSAEAATCIGDAIGRATVSEFSGSLVTVGTTWFVP